MIAAAVIASAAVTHVQAPTPQFTATTTYSYSTEKHDLASDVDWPYEIQQPPMRLADPAPPSAKAASVESVAVAVPQPVAVAAPGDVPWYVPAEWRERWRACLDHPERRNVSQWVWDYSVQSGRSPGWDYNEAMRIVGAEGGNDLCQFNTQGSGACSWFQTLSCAGLTPEAQLEGAFAKWLDGGGSFQRHWYNFWK